MEAASVSLCSKELTWEPVSAEEGYVHPVKKLCLRATSPRGSQGQELVCALPTGAEEAPLCLPADEEPGSTTFDLNDLPCDKEAEGAPTQGTKVSGTPEASPSLECLGEDLLLHVLRLAAPTAWDLSRMACVSRVWRDACYNRVFWTKLRVGSGSMRPGVEQLASRCANLVELHIDDPRCELYVLHPIVVSCGPSLRRLAINCDMDTSNRNEASICSILWLVSLYCKSVDTVELLSDGARGGFSYLESKALWYLTSGFRQMRSFASLCQESVTKQSLYLMVIAWRDLACLRIHCGLLGRDDLASLRKCHALRVLELVGGRLGAMVGGVSAERREVKERVIHSRLEVVVLSDIVCEPQDVVSLSQLCPGLRRVLLSRGSWARGDSVQAVARQRYQFKLLQTWLLVAKGIELLVED